MQLYRRSNTLGSIWFFTINTQNRIPVLTQLPFYHALKSSIKEVKDKYPFSIIAFVLLPDHFHCIWELPDGDADYSTECNALSFKGKSLEGLRCYRTILFHESVFQQLGNVF